MHKRLAMLFLFAAVAHAASGASIDATIRGTGQPLAIELLVRSGESDWNTITHRALDRTSRRVHFDALEAGVYQLRIRGQQPTEQHATKIILGSKDARTIVIDVEPVELIGRVTYAGTEITGALFLRHAEFQWRGGIALAADGTFRAPLWQRGEYACEVRAPALATPFHDVVQIVDPSNVTIDIPDGRIRGVVRQANGGAPVVRASVVVESNSVLRTATDANGTFDFTGIQDGRYEVSVASPLHLDPAPITVEIGGMTRQRELVFDLDRGRTLPLVVVDPQQAPVSGAIVYAVAGTKVCSRTITDGDGRTNVAVPADEDATLFVIPSSGAFGVHRVAKNASDALRVALPPASSSLLIRTHTSNGADMPPFSLLMRYDGAVVPPEVAEELAFTQGLTLAKGEDADVRLERIPSGTYEFWPYRTKDEAEAILATANDLAAPIHIDVHSGANSVEVRFAAR